MPAEQGNNPLYRKNGFAAGGSEQTPAAFIDSAGNIKAGGTLVVTGATTISGLVSSTGGRAAQPEIQAGDDTLVAADSGKVFICTKTSATQTFTLPAATVPCVFTWVTTSAASEVLINPASSSDTIQIKATVDQGASVVTTAGTGIKNTAATNVVGDNITLVSNGLTAWIMIGQSGIWASQ